MAVYKVPQDVEADDKLIGPFSFKQFVFVLIGLGFGYMAFAMAKVSPFLVIVPLPFSLAFLVIGTPLRKDQPTDVYVAALINFWLRPKTRLWNQEGMTEHVMITAPKRDEHQYTDGLSRTEVESRLDNLAKVLDTRGWSAKNVDVPGFVSQSYSSSSDRLVATTMGASNMLVTDDADIDDVLDTNNSRIGQRIAEIQKFGHTPGPVVQPLHPEPALVDSPGTVVQPTGATTGLRTVSEIAAIADARNPIEHQEIAPIYTGDKGTRNREQGTKEERNKEQRGEGTNGEEKIEIPAGMHYDPKPEMLQAVVEPIHENPKDNPLDPQGLSLDTSTTDMTESTSADILEDDNNASTESPATDTEGSFGEGGETEISLH